MPSISQAKLNELSTAVEQARTKYADEAKRSEIASARVQRFDDILDKIVRAANGLPLIEDHNRGDYGMSPGYITSMDNGHRCEPPTTEEVQRNEIATLNERVVGLESRLAAVVAVATFAKDHKS